MYTSENENDRFDNTLIRAVVVVVGGVSCSCTIYDFRDFTDTLKF